MDETGLTRRKLLAGVAAAGGSGAAMGVGSGALLSDVELLGGNTLATGVLDMEITGDSGWSSEGTARIDIDFSNNSDGEERFTVSLPADRDNNPAYVWVGATCPTVTKNGPSNLLEYLNVDLRYDGSTASGSSIASGDLVEFANTLVGGKPIDGEGDGDLPPGSQACLQPESTVDLILDWKLDEEFEGSGAVTFELLFVGWQCRHNEAENNPFPEDPDDCPGPEGHDISWVGFCAEDGETLSIDTGDFTVTGDTLTIENPPDHLKTVVLKYSTWIRVFDFDESTNPYTTYSEGNVYPQNNGSGSGGPPGQSSAGDNSGPPEHAGPTSGGTGSDFVGTERSNSVPCPGTCGVKFDVNDDGSFDDGEPKGCEQNE